MGLTLNEKGPFTTQAILDYVRYYAVFEIISK